jgi:hypothetical protein
VRISGDCIGTQGKGKAVQHGSAGHLWDLILALKVNRGCPVGFNLVFESAGEGFHRGPYSIIKLNPLITNRARGDPMAGRNCLSKVTSKSLELPSLAKCNKDGV